MYNIYMIANEVDDKVYIGSTKKTITIRLSQHISDARRRSHSQLNDAMNQYGYDKFAVFLLETAMTKEESKLIETRYMLQYDTVRNGYNKEYAVDKAVAMDMILDMYHN